MLAEVLPAARGLASRVDIFVEEGAFSPEEAETYLRGAMGLGFAATVHGDQFSTGGSALACRLGARSVDHLESSGEEEIRMLGVSAKRTAAVVLPGASLGLGMGFAPARRLLDAGARLVIATDWNPGSAPNGDLLMQASVLAAAERLTSAEVFAGITFRAASALGLSGTGVLEEGGVADFIGFPCADWRDILYYQGTMKPSKIWKKGEHVL